MRIAIINANDIAKRREGAYPVLYKEVDERGAHKCVIDADATAGGNHPLPLNQ
jgi:glycine cleavage system protein P-like pyridoxal-binding family